MGYINMLSLYANYKVMKPLILSSNIKSSKLVFKCSAKIPGQNAFNLGCMGTKAGMTTWFLDTGEAIPCTVIAIETANIVTQIKSLEKDGYSAIQIGYKTAKRNKKPEMGHLNKVGAPPLRHLNEYRTHSSNFELGQKLYQSELFKEGDLVDVSGKSIGKGFQGGIKRWNMHRGFMTHGSKSHRAPGSIGMRYSGDGGRVMPGLKMAGRKGNKRTTIQKLPVIAIVMELNALVVKGSVPGKSGSLLSLSPTKKTR